MSVSRTNRPAFTQDVVSTGPAELAGTWEFDPTHTRLGFLARQMTLTTVRGTFREALGSASLDPGSPQKSEVSVTIQANSVETGSSRRDAHLRSAAFFETETYPTIEFRSIELRPTKEPDVWRVVGDLTIHGVTRPVVLTMTYLGSWDDPRLGTCARFEGTAKVNRKDWGVKWIRAIEAGGIVIGDHVKLELEVQAIKKQ